MKALTDTIKPTVKDTSITSSVPTHCTNPGHCKNHPLKPNMDVKFISPLVINFHDAISLEPQVLTTDDSGFFNNTELHTFANQDTQALQLTPVSATTQKQMLPIDSIKPCDEKFLQQGDVRLSHEIIGVIPQPKTLDDFTEMKYEPMAQGMLLTFMLYITTLYITRSANHWACLAKELKQVYSA
jgi:hypothetical protein